MNSLDSLIIQGFTVKILLKTHPHTQELERLGVVYVWGIKTHSVLEVGATVTVAARGRPERGV